MISLIQFKVSKRSHLKTWTYFWLFHFLQVIADGFTKPVTNLVTHLDMMNSLPTKLVFTRQTLNWNKVI